MKYADLKKQMTRPTPRGAIFFTLALCTLGFTISCGSDFTPVTRLEKLRVMALRAEPPRINPDESTQLSALLFTPTPETIAYSWSWCPFTTSATQNYACAIQEGEFQTLVNEVLPEEDRFTVPSYALGTTPSVEFTHSMTPHALSALCEAMLAGELPKFARLPDCSTSFPITIKLVAKTQDDEVIAIKTVDLKYETSAPDNANPLLGEVYATASDNEAEVRAIPADNELSMMRSTEYQLRIVAPTEAAETYIAADGSSITERLVVSWFVEAGDLQWIRSTFAPDEASGSDGFEAFNHWSLPDSDLYGAGQARIYTVIRDDRGGTNWMSRTISLEVQP